MKCLIFKAVMYLITVLMFFFSGHDQLTIAAEAGINYGVAVFHDENGNRKFDENFLGIPKEGQGASNGAVGRHGPPIFDDARFLLDEGTKSLTINLHY